MEFSGPFYSAVSLSRHIGQLLGNEELEKEEEALVRCKEDGIQRTEIPSRKEG